MNEELLENNNGEEGLNPFGFTGQDNINLESTEEERVERYFRIMDGIN